MKNILFAVIIILVSTGINYYYQGIVIREITQSGFEKFDQIEANQNQLRLQQENFRSEIDILTNSIPTPTPTIIDNEISPVPTLTYVEGSLEFKNTSTGELAQKYKITLDRFYPNLILEENLLKTSITIYTPSARVQISVNYSEVTNNLDDNYINKESIAFKEGKGLTNVTKGPESVQVYGNYQRAFLYYTTVGTANEKYRVRANCHYKTNEKDAVEECDKVVENLMISAS